MTDGGGESLDVVSAADQEPDTPHGSVQDRQSDRVGPRLWSLAVPRLWVIVPCVAYLLLTLLGATTSSIGIRTLRQDPAVRHGTEIGAPQPIRSDEYMTESPIVLGQIALGTKNPINPLSVSPDYFSQIPTGPVSSVVFFEGTAIRLRLLPDAMLFAAKWWLPTLMLFLGVPAWFRRVTGSRRWGYLAVALIVFSPSNLWWSLRPINTLGFVFAACALLLLAHEKLLRRRWFGFSVCIAAAAILTARYSTYYQPLAIVVGLPVFLTTAVFILATEGKLRPKLLTVGTFAAVGAAVAGAVAWENIDAIRSGLNTVYPGHRVSTGARTGVGRIFGAPEMGTLYHTQFHLGRTNATEVSSSFTVLILVVALLAVSSRWRGGRATGAATLAAGVMALFWLSWCTINYGSFGAALPILNRVPPARAASGVGFVAIFAFCLFMAQWKTTPRIKHAAAAGLLTALVSAYAGTSLHRVGMTLLSDQVIWASAVLAGVCVFALVRWPASALPMIATTAAVALLAVHTNPVEFGLADLRSSSTAKTMLQLGRQSRAHGELWASNDFTFDSLMFATATPALSSRQQIGPNDKEWLKLTRGVHTAASGTGAVRSSASSGAIRPASSGHSPTPIRS